MTYIPSIWGPDSSGAVPTKPPVLTAGSDGTDVRTLATDPYGRLVSPYASTLNDWVVSPRLNQLDINFSVPFNVAVITNTVSGGGTATQANGCATYSTTSSSTAESNGTTVQTLFYRPGHEWFCNVTASFATPTDATNVNHQRIGPFSATDGFYISYEKTTFGLTQRVGSADTFIARASWNGDPADGSAGSKFRSNGTPVALDLTKINVFRIHGAWHGVANILLEILSPDGVWVILHTYRFANIRTTPYTATTTFPIQVDVQKVSSDATVLAIATASWALGICDPTAEAAATETVAVSAAVFTSATASDTAVVVNTVGFGNCTFSFIKSGSISIGVLTFEASPNGADWFPLDVQAVNTATTSFVTTYSMTGASQMWQMFVGGFYQVRVRLSTAITGTGNATVILRPSLSGTEFAQTVFQPTGSNLHTAVDSLPSLPAGSATIGSVRGIEADNATNSVLKLPVIPAVANAADPTWTEAHEAPISVDLTGYARSVVKGVVSTKTALTASFPTAATIGVASGAAIGTNSARKGLVLVNTSTNTISLGFGAAAVLNSGITLNPTGGTFVMDEFTFFTGAINAIASGATSNLSVQEFTT